MLRILDPQLKWWRKNWMKRRITWKVCIAFLVISQQHLFFRNCLTLLWIWRNMPRPILLIILIPYMLNMYVYCIQEDAQNEWSREDHLLLTLLSYPFLLFELNWMERKVMIMESPQLEVFHRASKDDRHIRVFTWLTFDTDDLNYLVVCRFDQTLEKS
jgi:hypothetical protein